MHNKVLIAALAGALSLGAASAASATTAVYDFSVYDAAFVGNLGTVTVTDHGTQTLDIDVILAANTFFQLTNGNLHDAFWFDLPGLAGNTSVTYNITAPNGLDPGADYPTGGLFTGANYSNNAYGQGWSSGYDYAIQVQDSINPNQFYGNGNHLTFTITGNLPLSIASLGAGQDGGIVFGADLRQCITQSCVTGPAGAIIRELPPGVPEPASWLMMIMGFGGIGAMVRRRRGVAFA